MFDDLIPTIIQILIEEKKEMVVSEIVEESSFGEVEIQRGLNLLYDLGIVNRAELSKNNFKYFLVKELKGIHLATAAQLGIDLNAFDKHFKIDKKEKKLALEIASNAEKVKYLEPTKRRALIQSRPYINISKKDDVAENLILLLEAANVTLYEYIEKLAKEDKNLHLIMELHAQAENTVQNYLNSLK